MADRSVLQWDKDDCAAAGLVKFDLLGLGMLAALHYTLRPRRTSTTGEPLDLAELDLAGRPAVYDMLCRRRRDRGVPGRESAPRWPRCRGCAPQSFYDLVVEVALIRPGPIQGGSVHPYIAPQQATRRGDLPPPAAGERRCTRPWACRCSRSR